jgi:hypothetical protein
MHHINFHPVFAEDFLRQGHKKVDLVGGDQDSVDRRFDFYPLATRGTYTCVHSIKIQIGFDARDYELLLLSDGMFCVMSRSIGKLNELSFNALKATAEDERKLISEWLRSAEANSAVILLSKHRNISSPSASLTLGDAFSQNIIHREEAGYLKGKLESSAWISASNEFFFAVDAVPAVNLFDVVAEKTDLLINSLATITILMGSLYEIQEQAMRTSRLLAETQRDQKGVRSVLRDADQKSGLFLQHAVELSLLDFLSDPFEEMLGRTTMAAWAWPKLIDSTLKAVRHLSDQVVKLDAEIGRQTERRVTKLLIAFTFLTVIDVCGNMITLYDVSNSIMPYIRLSSVLSALVLSILIASIYIRGI